MVVLEAVLAALAGAFCFAVAAALQHHEASRDTTAGVTDPRLLWRLAHRPLWWWGVTATVLGGALHLYALSKTPLTVVQPLGVTCLVFALPLGAGLHRHRVRRTELAAALVLLAGLMVLLGVVPVGPSANLVDPGLVAVVVAAAAGTAAATATVARLASGRLRSLLLAFGAAVAFGVTSAMARVLMQLGGLPARLAVPDLTVSTGRSILFAGIAIALLAPVGFLLLQSAYRAGGFAVTLATLTVVDPIAAAAGGVLLLNEQLPATSHAGLVAVGAVLLIVGIAVLVRSPANAPAPGPANAPVPVPVPPNLGGRRRVRVLIGTDTYHPDVNGAAYFSYRLAAGLAARGHEVHVVCPSPTGPAGTSVKDGVVVHRLRSAPTLVHPTFRVCLPPLVGRDVTAVLDDVAPDVVHLQGHFTVGRSLMKAARRHAVPVVATNHFMPDNYFLADPRLPAAVGAVLRKLAWRDFARVFNHADQVTTPTPIAADLIAGTGLRPPVQAISCGIDLDRFHRTGPGRTAGPFGLPDRPTLLFVGRLDQEKHLHELIAALPAIRRHVDAQVVLAGTGAQRQRLRDLARRDGVAEHVHFLGFVPDQQLAGVYAAANVFVMPGIAELQSLATLEAMASSLPVLAADAMALPHLVHPGVNGYLYPPGRPDLLAAQAVALLTAPQDVSRMGAASRAIAAGHDAAATLDRFEDLYANLPRLEPRPEPAPARAGRALHTPRSRD